MADPELSTADFARARSDQEFLGELVEKRRGKPQEKKKPGEAGGETSGGKPAEGSEGKPEVGEQEGTTPAKKSSRGGYKRMAERLQDKADALEQENADLKKRIEAGPISESKPKPAFPTGESPATGRPKEDDFESHVEYLEAVTDWKADQKDRGGVQEAGCEQSRQRQGEQPAAGRKGPKCVPEQSSGSRKEKSQGLR